MIAVVLAGTAAGLIGIAMAYLLEGFEWLFYGVAEGTLPERVEAAPPWRGVLAHALGGAAAGAPRGPCGGGSGPAVVWSALRTPSQTAREPRRRGWG